MEQFPCEIFGSIVGEGDDGPDRFCDPDEEGLQLLSKLF